MERGCRECPKEELKEVEERKRKRDPRMERAIEFFVNPKPVVSTNENSKYSLKILQLSWKASAAASQCRDIMAQVSIDAFYCEGVLLAVDIEDVLPRKDHVQISVVSVCTIDPAFWCHIHHLLDRSGRLVPAHNMPHDLPRFPAYHGYKIDVFPGFRSGFVFQKPV